MFVSMSGCVRVYESMGWCVWVYVYVSMGVFITRRESDFHVCDMCVMVV